MLPEVISNGLASLQPGKVRYTKTAVMEFTAEGLRGVDRVALGGHPQQQAAHLRAGRRVPGRMPRAALAQRQAAAARSTTCLGRMHTLAMILRKRRLANGALELTMPEVKVELDKQGRVAGAHVVENTESHQIIEEFMLAANEAVAETLRDRGLHFLRRIHQSPSPQKLEALHRVRRASWATRRRACKAASRCKSCWPPPTGRPEQHAVHFAVLRSLQRAIYSPMEEGHYALASECYCHFTSPIRRYPDLTVHRLVDAMLTETEAAERLRRAGRARPALLRPRAAGRGRRTRPDQAQAAGLPERPHRRGDGRRGDRRGELRPVRRRASSCRPKGWSASRPSATTTTASTAPRTRSPATAPATAIAWATCCAWPWRGSTWSGASWISAWWSGRSGKRRSPRRPGRSQEKARRRECGGTRQVAVSDVLDSTRCQ